MRLGLRGRTHSMMPDIFTFRRFSYRAPVHHCRSHLFDRICFFSGSVTRVYHTMGVVMLMHVNLKYYTILLSALPPPPSSCRVVAVTVVVVYAAAAVVFCPAPYCSTTYKLCVRHDVGPRDTIGRTHSL